MIESPPVFVSHWEREGQWVEAVKAIFSEPTEYFRATPKSGPLKDPLIFGVVVSAIGIAASAIWNLGLELTGMSLMSKFGGMESVMQSAGSTMMTIATYGAMIVLSPLLAALGLFLWSGITHLCLMMLGGATQDFSGTFRAASYASTPALLGLIPFCGGMIGGIWQMILMIIGVSEIHGISGMKAALAVLLPAIVLLLCCCGVGVIVASALGLAGAAALT